MTSRVLPATCLATLALLAVPHAQAPSPAPVIAASAYQALRYRVIGPFRASRTVGAVGIPTQPNVFYMGVNNGGVWKTDDYGRTWTPIFDQAPTGSIGDLAVSPSHPDVIYVGTGEGLHRPDLGVGDGIYKSTDGGRTWRHVGLADIQQVGRIVVHPTNPDIVFVAGMGHPYGPNDERGIFRTTDGGTTWQKVLFIDRNTGANQVEFDFTDPRVVYAALWEHREGPWENASVTGRNSGFYKSTDGGTTWTRLTGGLPTAAQGAGKVSFGLAPSNPNRVYAMVQAREGQGLYRSDDAGASWSFLTGDPRLSLELRVHPRNPDVAFVGNISSYKTEDGGRTWTAFKGAPGGDDYQRIWINPLQPDVMIFTADQGATITVNGGRTWSSWYNQPTAQLYHVTTDSQFPYWVYGGQQESGAIGIASRGHGGQVSFRDWIGVGADEYAYVAPDPLNPDIVYGGRVVRFNRRTGQAQHVAPEALRSGKYRILRTMPLLFHPADPKTLFFATNVLWKTMNGGEDWEIVSPDLSRERPDVPESIADYRTPDMDTMPRRGVIYAVSPSRLDANVIWAGTDDGLVHVTRDGGKTWSNTTPPALRSWDKVSQIDASHADVRTAYVSVNAFRRHDLRPYIYRTRDGGSTWTLVVSGLPANEPVNVVREDPKQAGLLFAGTERAVYFSPDAGDHWLPLRQNMPASSVRDLVIHADDLVVGTHGRSIWILDGITPLRQLAEAARATSAFLFTPPLATRVRWNMFSDTPLPPEEPTGENPPEGVVIDYHLPAAARHVAVEVRDGQGAVVRRYASDDTSETLEWNALQYPTYWLRPPHAVATSAGHHRLAWDLRWTPPRGTKRELSIAAVRRNTPTGPRGPLVHPGRYTVRLTVDGASTERPLDVRLDPRVSIAPADLQLNTDYALRSYRGYLRAQDLRERIDAQLAKTGPDAVAPAQRERWSALRGAGVPGDPDVLYDSIVDTAPEQETVVGIQHKYLFMLNLIQGADARPTPQAMRAVERLDEIWRGVERRY